MNHRFYTKLSFALSLAIVLSLLLAPLALADIVQNDVTGSSDNDTFTVGGSTTVNYRIVSTGGDGQAGCNAADGSAATVTIFTPAGVTASPGSLTFTSCGTYKAVNFTSTTPGNYSITVSVSDSGPGTYNTNPADFTLHVLQPPDTTPPAITIITPPEGAVYLLYETVLASYSCEDTESGVASCVGTVANGAALNTASVGVKTFTVDAADNAYNTASLTHNYRVIYDWDGFFSPVSNDLLNVGKAGSAIPVKFSLVGDQGLSIIETGYPEVRSISCDVTATEQTIDETATAGSSSLSYDALEDQYVYVWKTEKNWSGSCRQFNLKLIDGTMHSFVVNFTK